jgi:hypothetical protein
MSPEELSLMELALLFRMPLYKLMNEMPYEEYLLWGEYLSERPIGVREDYRTALLLSAQAPKADIGKLFPSLAIKQKNENSIVNSVFYQLMKKSTGGIILEG